MLPASLSLSDLLRFAPASAGRRGVLARMIEALRAEVEARQAMRHLAEMDEHMLRDLGLARGDIPAAVRQGARGLGASAEGAPRR